MPETRPYPTTVVWLLRFPTLATRPLLALAAGFAFFAHAAVPRTATAQIFGRQTVSTTGHFIEAPRGILSRVREAKEAIEAGRVNEAIVELGEIAARQPRPGQDDDLIGQDFFLDADKIREGMVAEKTLMRSVRDLIGSLPESALQTYELRYGPSARKDLNAASLNQNWRLVESVRRRYFHTLAGFEASYLLAQRQMYDGHPLHASLLLDQITGNQRAMDHLGSSTFLLHAMACSLAGRPLPPVDRIAGQSMTVGDESFSIESENDLKSWLDANLNLQTQFKPESVMDYPMFGADPGRNGNDVGQMPLSKARWRLPTSGTPRQSRAIEGMKDELASSGQLPPPSWMPLKVGDQLIMRTTELLVGVDYETGKRLWVKPWESGFEPLEDDEAGYEEMVDEAQRNESLRQKIWNDVPYGHVTSDGQRVFMLTDLSSMRIAMFSRGRLRGLRPPEKQKNSLYALDLDSEGKLLWKLGKGGGEESQFADAFFLGPPLPVDGLLYVMAEIAGDINLCCLEPTSGKELWRQHLVAVESGGIDSDPIRRIAGAMPTYHEGVLICPTGTGVTVAVDIAERSLRWGATYGRRRSVSQYPANRFGGNANNNLSRWDVGVAVADGTTVLLTPPESDRMYSFDLATGKKKFSEQLRMKLRYLAGVRDEKFLLVGSNRIRAFNLSDGSEAWTSPNDMLAAGQQIAGRGVFGDGDYLLPTTTNELIRLSLETGKVLQRRSTRYPLGNLVAVENDLIIQSPTTLSVSYGERTLEPIVNRLLEKDPNDFDAMVRKAQLLIEQDQRGDALNLLNRARKLEPDNHDVRSLSVTAMLGLLREDSQAGEDYVDAATQLIEQPAHWIELLALRANGSIERGEYVDAADRLIEMSARMIDAGELDGLSDNLIADPSRTCTLDAWMASRMHEIKSKSSKQQRSTIEDRIGDALKSESYFSLPQFHRVFRHFECWDAAAALYSNMLAKYQVEKDWMSAERTLIGSRVYPTDDLSDLRLFELLLLAKNYADAHMFQDARRMLEAFEERSGRAANANTEEQGQALNEQVDEIWEEIELGLVQADWSQKASLKDWPATTNPRSRTPISSTTIGQTILEGGQQFAGWRIVSERNSRLNVRDALGSKRGISTEPLPNSTGASVARISGSTLVAMTADSMVCVDLNKFGRVQSNAVRWQRNFSGDGGPIAKRVKSISKFGGPINRFKINSLTAAASTPELVLGPVLGDRVIYLQGGDLVAIDLITKEVLWRNSGAPVQGAVLVHGDQVAVVSDSDRQVAFFNLHDGSRISSRDWDHGVIWGSAGKHVLSYVDPERRNQEFEIRLTDVFADNVILKQTSLGANRGHSAVPAAYGQVVSGRYLAWVQTDGQSLLWDIQKGTALSAPEVPAYDDLAGLHVLELDGKFILLPSRKVKYENVELIGQELITQSGQNHRTTNAAIAVDSSSGKTIWSKEFKRPWGCTTSHVYGSPVIALVRTQVQQPLTNRGREKFMDVMFLRSDDGTEIFRKEGKKIPMNNNFVETNIVVQPQVKQVTARIGMTETLTFQFGESKTPGEDTEQP